MKDAEYCLVSKKIWAIKMAHWVGAKDQVHVAKKLKTCPNCDVTHREPQTQNEKNIFTLS